MRPTKLRGLLPCIALIAIASRTLAQDSSPSRAYATRGELETLSSELAAQAVDAKRPAAARAQSAAEERELRERLAVGDFRVGDRIVVHVTGEIARLDTLSVTPTRTLRVPDAGDLPLNGVLRSELDDRLNAQVALYIKNATVRAQPLTRLAVLGEVRTPGFVHVPSQALLSDVITAAGGPTATARLDRASIRRGGRVVVSPAAFSKGLASGATLDDMGLWAGDEVVVGAKESFNWTQLAQTAAVVVGAAATVLAISHR